MLPQHQPEEKKPSRTKKSNDWEPLQQEQRNVRQLTTKPYDQIIGEVLTADRSFFATRENIYVNSDGTQQTRFYSFKVNDLYFLEDRRHFEYLATSMLPIDCGYGLATYDYLKLGPTFCYRGDTKYSVGFNRDVNSSAHVEDMKTDKRKAWLQANCATGSDPIGRATYETDLSVRKQSGFDGYDIFLKAWLEDDSKEIPNGLILDQIDGVITYSGTFKNGNHQIIKVKNQKTNIPAPYPFTIGLLRPKREDILKYASNTGHYCLGRDNRAKPRKTANELEASMRRRWKRTQDAYQKRKPISYETQGRKKRTSASDYGFFMLEHVHLPGVPRYSLKYSEVFLMPKHLDSEGNAGQGKFDTSDLSHLLITEGIVGKSSLGNALWAVTAQYYFLNTYGHYLPIHVYNHQTGHHIRIPEENLKFLYMLWHALPYLSQEQLDTNFFCLLEEDKDKTDKYSALLTTQGIQKACEKVSIQSIQARATKDPACTQLLQTYLSYFPPEEKKPPTIAQQFDTKITTNDFTDIHSYLENLKSHEIKELRQSQKIEELRELALRHKKFSLLALLDKHMGQWGKSYENEKPATKAAKEKQWDDVLKIASYRDLTEDKKIEPSDAKTTNFAELGHALLIAAQESQWDNVVIPLIQKYKINHFVWHQSDYFVIHYAALANRVDVLKLMLENGGNIHSHHNNQNLTPLYFSMTTTGCTDAAIFLLKNGATIPSLEVNTSINTNLRDIHLRLVQTQETDLAQQLLKKFPQIIPQEIKHEAISPITPQGENNIHQDDCVIPQKPVVQIEQQIQAILTSIDEEHGKIHCNSKKLALLTDLKQHANDCVSYLNTSNLEEFNASFSKFEESLEKAKKVSLWHAPKIISLCVMLKGLMLILGGGLLIGLSVGLFAYTGGASSVLAIAGKVMIGAGIPLTMGGAVGYAITDSHPFFRKAHQLHEHLRESSKLKKKTLSG